MDHVQEDEDTIQYEDPFGFLNTSLELDDDDSSAELDDNDIFCPFPRDQSPTPCSFNLQEEETRSSSEIELVPDEDQKCKIAKPKDVCEKTSELGTSINLNVPPRKKKPKNRTKKSLLNRYECNNLPYGIILQIFSYLEEKDRSNLARTCKNFHAAFQSPVLWRSKRVLFAGIRSMETAAKSCVFVKNFGRHIKHLEVECGHPTLHSARPMSLAVELFLGRLSKIRGTKIISLKIDYMDFYHGWRFFELSRSRLVGALCKFLRKQRHLKFIDVSGAQIDSRDGSRVLKAMGASYAKNTLQTLLMKDFFELRYLPANNESFMTTLTKFTSLKEVYMNFFYLNESVLEILGERLGPKLEMIRLVVDSSEPRTRSVRTYDWLNIREKCPKLKVIMHFLGMLSYTEFTSAMCRGIPLVEIDILSWEGYPNDLGPDTERMSEVLIHVANHFHGDLARFRISIDHATLEDPLDNSFIVLLKKCGHLREFTMNARITLDTVDIICKLSAARRLDHLELRVRGLTQGDLPRLTEISQTYMNHLQKRRLTVYPDPNY